MFFSEPFKDYTADLNKVAQTCKKCLCYFLGKLSRNKICKQCSKSTN